MEMEKKNRDTCSESIHRLSSFGSTVSLSPRLYFLFCCVSLTVGAPRTFLVRIIKHQRDQGDPARAERDDSRSSSFRSTPLLLRQKNGNVLEETQKEKK